MYWEWRCQSSNVVSVRSSPFDSSKNSVTKKSCSPIIRSLLLCPPHEIFYGVRRFGVTQSFEYKQLHFILCCSTSIYRDRALVVPRLFELRSAFLPLAPSRGTAVYRCGGKGVGREILGVHKRCFLNETVVFTSFNLHPYRFYGGAPLKVALSLPCKKISDTFPESLNFRPMNGHSLRCEDFHRGFRSKMFLRVFHKTRSLEFQSSLLHIFDPFRRIFKKKNW